MDGKAADTAVPEIVEDGGQAGGAAIRDANTILRLHLFLRVGLSLAAGVPS